MNPGLSSSSKSPKTRDGIRLSTLAKVPEIRQNLKNFETSLDFEYPFEVHMFL